MYSDQAKKEEFENKHSTEELLTSGTVFKKSLYRDSSSEVNWKVDLSSQIPILLLFSMARNGQVTNRNRHIHGLTNTVPSSISVPICS